MSAEVAARRLAAARVVAEFARQKDRTIANGTDPHGEPFSIALAGGLSVYAAAFCPADWTLDAALADAINLTTTYPTTA